MRRGVPVSVLLRQAGPVSLQSFRANLICERIERGGRPWREEPLDQLSLPNQFLRRGPLDLTVPRLHVEDIGAELTVPSEADPSCETPRVKIRWRIEIWGKVDGAADFMRPFPIEVV